MADPATPAGEPAIVVAETEGRAIARAIRIELPAHPTVVVALSAPSSTVKAGRLLASIARDAGMRLHPAGPTRWLLAGEKNADKVIAEIERSCLGFVSALDQSSGRVLIRLGGSPVAEALAKGTALDLHDAAFPVGASAPVLMGHINVQLARPERDVYEIIVMRSFAESLYEELARMSAEFGYTTASA